MKCTVCGKEIPEGSAICEACKVQQEKDNKTIALLEKIEEGQQKNLKMLKSISSSTAILAAAVILQVILCIVLMLK